MRAETVEGRAESAFALRSDKVVKRGVSVSVESLATIEYPPTDGRQRRPKPMKKRWDLDVIVLDAGHGGEDAGAVVMDSKKRRRHSIIAKKIENYSKNSP